MKKNKKLWSYALAGALAVSNLSAVAMPMTAFAANAGDLVATAGTATPTEVNTKTWKVNQAGTINLAYTSSADVAENTTSTHRKLDGDNGASFDPSEWKTDASKDALSTVATLAAGDTTIKAQGDSSNYADISGHSYVFSVGESVQDATTIAVAGDDVQGSAGSYTAPVGTALTLTVTPERDILNCEAWRVVATGANSGKLTAASGTDSVTGSTADESSMFSSVWNLPSTTDVVTVTAQVTRNKFAATPVWEDVAMATITTSDANISSNTLTTDLTVTADEALKSNTAYSVGTSLTKNSIYDKVLISVSKEELTTLVSGDTDWTDDTNKFDSGVTTGTTGTVNVNLSTCKDVDESGTYYLQAWGVKLSTNNITDSKLIKTASGNTSKAITVYMDNAKSMTMSSNDTSNNIAAGQGSITVKATTDLNIADPTYNSGNKDFYWAIFSEADYNKLVYAIEDAAEKTVGNGKEFDSSPLTNLLDNTNFATVAAGTKPFSMASGNLSGSAQVQFNDAAVTTKGKYYLVAANYQLGTATAVYTDSIPNKDLIYEAYEFTVGAEEGAGLVISTGLNSAKTAVSVSSPTTGPTAGPIYLGSDVQLHAYITDPANSTKLTEADASKITWSVKPSSAAEITSDGLVHVKRTYTGNIDVTVSYQPESINGAEPAAKTNTFRFVNAVNDTVTASIDGAATGTAYLNIAKQLKATRLGAGTKDISGDSDVEWTVYKADGTTVADTATAVGGAFKATASGTYKVEAKYTPSEGTAVKSAQITVNVAAASMTLESKNGKTASGKGVAGALDSKSPVTTATLTVGDYVNIAVKVDTVDMTSNEETTFTSDDENVATFDGGVITAVGKGTANVTAKYGKLSKTIVVSVSEPAKATPTIAAVDDYDNTSANKLTIYEGEERTLGVFVDGEQLEGEFTFTSNTPSRVTIDSATGTLKGIAPGTSNITVTGTIDGKTWKNSTAYIVTVKSTKETELFYDDSTGSRVSDVKKDALSVGNVRAYYALAGGKDVEGEWTSSNSSVATVNTSGLVTAKAVGTATIKFDATDKDIKDATITLTVNAANLVLYSEGSKLAGAGAEPANGGTYTTAQNVAVNGALELTAMNGIEDVTDDITLKINSADEEFVKIDGNKISGLKVTTAAVAVTATYKTLSKIVNVNVIATAPTTSIDIDESAIALAVGGDSATITATRTPSYTADELIWTSSDTNGKYVKLTDNGDGTATIEPVAATTADVIITATSGNYSATCKVSVSETEEQADAINAANDAADAAKAAAEAAKKAADAAEKAPTAENIKAADEAIAKADAAAKAADDAIKSAKDLGLDTTDAEALVTEAKATNEAAATAAKAAKAAKDAADKAKAKADAITAANDAAKKAESEPTADNIAAAKKAIEDAKTAGASDEDLADASTKVASAETAKKAADDKDAAKADAITAANKAAEAAKAAPTEANIKAADDAIAAAKAAGATDEDLKAATDATAAAKAAKADADKKSDGSTTGKAPAAGTELKDATTGKETGYVVTNPEKFEVSFKGTADMSGTCAIPATVKDSAGNEYKVTSIAANAFADSDVTQINITGNITSIDPKAFANSKVKYISVKDAKLSKSAFKSLLKAKKGTQIKITGKNKKTNIKNLKKSKAYKKGRVKLVKKFNKKTSKKK
ncbi:Ig-like domain-containing protein [Butyrivibrio sp. AE3004]|uniref:Ig-like domain-containing protein n=1 Tax=Butyrivibrio sp. AE3004 TaxID=1506994 RepID=UPI00068B8E07|nr:Ig-like domain-containing protein [Butyrivibrio sp. AE3004]